MRLLATLILALALSACQTVGIESDPQRPYKATVVATTLAVDAVAIYGALPSCGAGVGDLCKKPKAYSDARLITTSFVETLKASDPVPSVFLSAGLLYYQYQLGKTLAGAPGPTNPEAPPSDSVAKQLQALAMADILISTLDDRVQEASGPNVTVEELLAELDRKVSLLPSP